MKKLTTQPYKGTRDFNPKAMQLQKYLFGVMRTTVEKYGYQEYGASVLEESELYRAKTGEEIVNEQTYNFTDRGGRDVTLRPEMTPTVARMIAGAGRDISFPARWYAIPNCFRYERPQRGRLREFWQLNVDLFGVDSAQADAEVLQVAYDLMRAYGADAETYVIRINSREIIQALFEEMKLDADAQYRLSKLIDRKDKMSAEAFTAQTQEIITNTYAIFENFMNAATLDDLSETLRRSKGGERLQRVVEILRGVGITNVVFTPTLMRGFDYYTGMIFEVFDMNPVNARALFGGGRYDDLTDLFDAPAIPAVGFGVSDVSMENYLETYNLLPTLKKETQVRICATEDEQTLIQLAQKIRAADRAVDIDFSARAIDKKLKTAQREGYRYVIVEEKGAIVLKNLEDYATQTVSEDEIVEILKENLGK